MDEKTKQDFEKRGWIVARSIGEGGGGEALLVYRRGFIEAVLNCALAGQGIGRGHEELTRMVLGNVSQVHDMLLRGEEWAAVLKVAKGDPSRTKREIEAMRRCVHPHVVRLLDADPNEVPSWFVMKFHPKGDLSTHLTEFKGDPIAVLRKIRPVVDAVALLHGATFVHRDIKARNIFVNSAGEWILGDFGIAYEKGGERLTESDQSLFSKDWRPDWVAGRKPEDFGPSVDIFGLAKVIYYMITGLKVPASQIDEPHADIRRLYPNAPAVVVSRFVWNLQWPQIPAELTSPIAYRSDIRPRASSVR